MQNQNKTSKAAARKLAYAIVNEANAIIHRENLYICLPDQNRRVVFAHINLQHGVEDLYSGQLWPIAGNVFQNGYGSTVVLDGRVL